MDSAMRRRKLFYAEAAAGLYDKTIDWVVPHYHLLHGTIRILLRAHAAVRGAGGSVLDVGSGTGAESQAVLEEVPQSTVIALDVCGPMRRIHEAKASVDHLERTTFVTADVMECLAHPRQLGQWLPDESPGFEVVVTAFAIHHLEQSEKVQFYRAAFDALGSGGRLINGDLFSASDPVVDEAFLAHDLAWIETHFSEAADAGLIDEDRAANLSERWVSHYVEDNRCEPLEARGDEPGQLEMMRSAGFVRVSVPYRFSLSAVVTGLKP